MLVGEKVSSTKGILPSLDRAINIIVACACFPKDDPLKGVSTSCMDCFGYLNGVVELLRSGKKVTKKVKCMISSLEHLISGYEKCNLTNQQDCVTMGHLNTFVVLLRELLRLKFSQRLIDFKGYYFQNCLTFHTGNFQLIIKKVENLLQEMERFEQYPWTIWGQEIIDALPIDDTRAFLGLLEKTHQSFGEMENNTGN